MTRADAIAACTDYTETVESLPTRHPGFASRPRQDAEPQHTASAETFTAPAATTGEQHNRPTQAPTGTTPKTALDDWWNPRIPLPGFVPGLPNLTKGLRYGSEEWKQAKQQQRVAYDAAKKKWLASLTPEQLAEHMRIEKANAAWAAEQVAIDARADRERTDPQRLRQPADTHYAASQPNRASTFKTRNLARFLRIGGPSFDIGGWLQSVAPENVRHIYDDGVDFKCTNEDGHTDSNSNDRAFRVWNGKGREGGFGAHCCHSGCIEAFRKDRGRHLDMDLNPRSPFKGRMPHNVTMDGHVFGVDGQKRFFAPLNLALVDDVDELTELDSKLNIIKDHEVPERVLKKLHGMGKLQLL